jgi:hypothetical protein
MSTLSETVPAETSSIVPEGWMMVMGPKPTTKVIDAGDPNVVRIEYTYHVYMIKVDE